MLCTHIRSVADFAFACGSGQEWASAALVFLAGGVLGRGGGRSAGAWGCSLDGGGVSILAAVILSICDGFFFVLKLGDREGWN